MHDKCTVYPTDRLVSIYDGLQCIIELWTHCRCIYDGKKRCGCKIRIISRAVQYAHCVALKTNNKHPIQMSCSFNMVNEILPIATSVAFTILSACHMIAAFVSVALILSFVSISFFFQFSWLWQACIHTRSNRDTLEFDFPIISNKKCTHTCWIAFDLIRI